MELTYFEGLTAGDRRPGYGCDMPQVRGVELVERITGLRPQIHVLFMSGYSEDALVEDQFIKRRDVAFIQKPFDPEDLARKIRESLGSNRKAPS